MAEPGGAGELAERIKELNCLYGISRLLGLESQSLEETLARVVELIPSAWRYPQRTWARIVLGGREIRSAGPTGPGPTLIEPIALRGGEAGFVEVGVGGAPPADGPVFLEDERRLLEAIAELIAGTVERKESELNLRKAARELREQKAELDRKNAALKEIISQIEREKRELQEQVRADIGVIVLPLLNRLKNPDLAPEARADLLRIVEQNLQTIGSSFARQVVSDRVQLSPREVEIGGLVRGGMSNKEIAVALGLSVLTVERHRHNIRRKLRIAGQKVNLATYLHEL